MFRLVFTIIIYFPWNIYFYFKMKRGIKNKKLNLQERYDISRNIVSSITKKSRAKVDVYGLENLPKNNGYVLFPNHQGRYDGLAIVKAIPRQTTFVIDDARSHVSIEGTFMDLVKAKRIDKNNPRQMLQAFKEVSDEVISGVNYCIFPEGYYSDNKNNLQEFKTGCLRFLKHAKCPILPVCLYDTYKVYNVNSYKKVKCEVHILEPIQYETYKDMHVKDIAELIKSKIQERIDELNKKVA